MSFVFDLIKKAKGASIEKTTDAERIERLKICHACPKLTKTGNCSKCLCFVYDKVKYKKEQCPFKKW